MLELMQRALAASRPEQERLARELGYQDVDPSLPNYNPFVSFGEARARR